MVAPGFASLLSGLLSPTPSPEPTRTEWSVWPLLASALVALAVMLGVPFGGLDPNRWPLQAVPALDRQPVHARLFHEQDWGGMIEAECRPARRTFLDDRFELFGKQTILEYIKALQGGPEWDALQARERFDLVWIRPERELARRLEADPAWQVIHRDAVSVLFRRKSST
jgi:hypothetical protein